MLLTECDASERAAIEGLLSRWEDQEEAPEPRSTPVTKSTEPEQCWLTVEFDTSGMKFPSREYWKDSRFLRHKSVAAVLEKVSGKCDGS